MNGFEVWLLVLLVLLIIASLVYYWATHRGALHPEVALFASFDSVLQEAVARACHKVQIDPSFAGYAGSNLGRNVRRDEAAEWAKLYLKDQGAVFRDSDVHLACELFYRRNIGRY